MRLYYGYDEVNVRCTEVMRETEKAVLCRFEDMQVWLPVSLLLNIPIVGEERVLIKMPFWLIEKNELEDFIED